MFGVSQVLRNAVGEGGCLVSRKKRYEGVQHNVISVTRWWVEVKCPGEKRYVTLEWPLCAPCRAHKRATVERGSSVVECWTRNQVSPGSNHSLIPFRILGIFVLSIDAPVHSAV